MKKTYTGRLHRKVIFWAAVAGVATGLTIGAITTTADQPSKTGDTYVDLEGAHKIERTMIPYYMGEGTEGVSVAVDPSVIPLGSVVMLSGDGLTCYVADQELPEGRGPIAIYTQDPHQRYATRQAAVYWWD